MLGKDRKQLFLDCPASLMAEHDKPRRADALRVLQAAHDLRGKSRFQRRARRTFFAEVHRDCDSDGMSAFKRSTTSILSPEGRLNLFNYEHPRQSFAARPFRVRWCSA
jgi:hypothetical protein